MKDPCEGLNPDGTIRTGADRRRVPPEFEPILSAAARALRAVAGGAAELHLYGSVANGTAQPGVSDVDLLAINVPPGWCRNTSVELTARFSHLCRAVEIGEGTSGDFLGDARAARSVARKTLFAAAVGRGRGEPAASGPEPSSHRPRLPLGSRPRMLDRCPHPMRGGGHVQCVHPERHE